MKRRRTIASAPQRNTGQAWGTITTLVADTLDRSPQIARADVETALARADGIGRGLIAGGHLETHPLVLVAGEVFLEITTVSGAEALTLEENLNPVPGAADADDWTLHMPQCEPLAKLVRGIAKGDPHLSSDEAKQSATPKALSTAGGVDDAALARWAEDGL